MGAEWERVSEMKARGKGGREAGRRKAQKRERIGGVGNEAQCQREEGKKSTVRDERRRNSKKWR